MITMNHHPLHTNAWFAEHETVQGKNVVVGNLVYSLVLGMSVPDVSGSCIANLEVESLLHRSPTFHGDTIYAETAGARQPSPSKSKPDRGIVTVETKAFNQRGEEVCYFRRKLMVWKHGSRPAAPPSLRRRRLGLSRRPGGPGPALPRPACSSGAWRIAAICRGAPPVTRGRILVSEVMLQQTQADRVVGLLPGVPGAGSPTPAAAPGRRLGDVVRLWSGLGYNRRALNLHRAAVRDRRRARRRGPRRSSGPCAPCPAWVRTPPGPCWPFAFEADVAVVDTNVVRVLARGVAGAGADAGARPSRWPTGCCPAGRSWEFNQAMFDLGCHGVHRGPPGRAASCPLRRQCRWKRGRPDGPRPLAGLSPRCARRPPSPDPTVRAGAVWSMPCARARCPGPVAAACGWPDDPARAQRITAALVAEGFAEWSADGPPVLSLR